MRQWPLHGAWAPRARRWPPWLRVAPTACTRRAAVRSRCAGQPCRGPLGRVHSLPRPLLSATRAVRRPPTAPRRTYVSNLMRCFVGVRWRAPCPPERAPPCDRGAQVQPAAWSAPQALHWPSFAWRDTGRFGCVCLGGCRKTVRRLRAPPRSGPGERRAHALRTVARSCGPPGVPARMRLTDHRSHGPPSSQRLRVPLCRRRGQPAACA